VRPPLTDLTDEQSARLKKLIEATQSVKKPMAAAAV
jgi:hypothetical protein